MARRVTSSELDTIVRKKRQPATILFFGDWCVDCRLFRPVWESWSKRQKDTILMVEVLRGGPEWEEWQIEEIPTVARFDQGEEKARVAGMISKDDLDQLKR